MMKLVIFDCDGTIVDTQDKIGANMKEAFESLDLVWPGQAATRGIIGLSLLQAMRKLFPAGEHFQHEALVVRYKEISHRETDADQTPVMSFYDGALEAIKWLRARDDMFLAIATGKSHRGVLHMLKAAKLPVNAFISIQTADSAASKPHPEMIMNAMADAGGIGGHDTVMVGDASYDMEMARSANVHAVGVDWGYQSVETLENSGAHKIMSHFSQLDGMLKEFWPER